VKQGCCNLQDGRHQYLEIGSPHLSNTGC
jgi:hypothetical protein